MQAALWVEEIGFSDLRDDADARRRVRALAFQRQQRQALIEFAMRGRAVVV